MTNETKSVPLYIIFDGPPSHESGRFVEVETAEGKGVCVGEWTQDGDYWKLGPLYAAAPTPEPPSTRFNAAHTPTERRVETRRIRINDTRDPDKFDRRAPSNAAGQVQDTAASQPANPESVRPESVPAAPDAYAIRNDQGYWVGIWNTLEQAQAVLAKGQPSHKEEIVSLYHHRFYEKAERRSGQRRLRDPYHPCGQRRGKPDRRTAPNAAGQEAGKELGRASGDMPVPAAPEPAPSNESRLPLSSISIPGIVMLLDKLVDRKNLELRNSLRDIGNQALAAIELEKELIDRKEHDAAAPLINCNCRICSAMRENAELKARLK